MKISQQQPVNLNHKHSKETFFPPDITKRVLIGISTSLEGWVGYVCIHGVIKTYSKNMSFYSQNEVISKSVFLSKLKLLAVIKMLENPEISPIDSIHITSESPYLSECSINGYMWTQSKRKNNDEEIKSFLETMEKFPYIEFFTKRYKIKIPSQSEIRHLDEVPTRIYVDGFCIKTRRFGGWAAVIEYTKSSKVVILKGHEKDTNINIMRLRAMIEALRNVVDTKYSIIIYTDNIYCVHCFAKSHVWRYDDSNINKELIKALDDAKNNIKTPMDIELKAHYGVYENRRADIHAINEAYKNFPVKPYVRFSRMR